MSRFSGNDHLTDRQKGPRAHRPERLMSVFTVSLPGLTLSALQQGDSEYQPARGALLRATDTEEWPPFWEDDKSRASIHSDC